jgi:hypothetical protein
MKSIKRILFGLALAGLLCAQSAKPGDTAQAESPRLKRIFPVKYADVEELANVLGVFGYWVKANRDLHVLAVSAPADVMNAIEDAIKRLDVPGAAAHDIDLTVYMVLASEQPASGILPPDLQAVANEMKSVFSYKGFRLLDSILLRTQPGNMAHSAGIVTAGADSKAQYSFGVRPSAVMEDSKGRSIRLNNLSLNLHVGGQDAGINTEITVREGQKVVVGKSNMGAADQALILVVSAKVVD